MGKENLLAGRGFNVTGDQTDSTATSHNHQKGVLSPVHKYIQNITFIDTTTHIMLSLPPSPHTVTSTVIRWSRWGLTLPSMPHGLLWTQHHLRSVCHKASISKTSNAVGSTWLESSSDYTHSSSVSIGLKPCQFLSSFKNGVRYSLFSCGVFEANRRVYPVFLETFPGDGSM